MRQLVTVACAVVTFGSVTFGQSQPNGAASDFGAKYASLKPEQKALVDDWIRRFSATLHKQVDPRMAYDNLPVSMKTTFNAVTHALLSTQLADPSGGNLGSAIQIIDKLDTVKGEVQRCPWRQAVPHLRATKARCAGLTRQERAVSASRRQHGLSQGISNLLSRQAGSPLHPGIGDARSDASRH